MAKQPINIVYPSLIGFCALAIGLGLGRFAFTPLAPLMQQQHHLTQQIAHLAGVVNFWGYFLGIMLANMILKHFPAKLIVLASSALCVVSLGFSSLFDYSIPFVLCHALSGISGALIMISTPVFISRSVSNQQKVPVFGAMFSGVGFGIVCSAFIAYAGAFVSLSSLWNIVTFVGLSFFVIVYLCMQKIPEDKIQHPSGKKPSIEWTYVFVLFILAYSFFAIGMTPHFIYIEDYMGSVLSLDDKYIDFAWLCYGLCIMFGTPLLTYIAQKTSIFVMLMFLLIVASISLFELLYFHSLLSLLISYCLSGLSAMSIVSLVSSVLARRLDPSQLAVHWSLLTIFFSLWQSIASSVFDWWLTHNTSYMQVFLTSGTALVASCVCIFLVSKARPKGR